MTNSNAIRELVGLLVPLLRTENQQKTFVKGVVEDPSFSKNFQFGTSAEIFAEMLIETLQNAEQHDSQPALMLIAAYVEKNQLLQKQPAAWVRKYCEQIGYSVSSKPTPNKRQSTTPTASNNSRTTSHNVTITGNNNNLGSITQGNNNTVTTNNVNLMAQPLANPQQLFSFLASKIKNISDETDRETALIQVKALKNELAKGDAADKELLRKRMRFVRTTLADAFEVMVATLINPAAGFGMVAAKIAAEVKSATD